MIKFEIIVRSESLLEKYKDIPAFEILDDFKNNPTGWMTHSDIKVDIGTKCMDCGKQLEEPDGIPGILPGAWAILDKKHTHLGYRCNDCSVYGQKEKEMN